MSDAIFNAAVFGILTPAVVAGLLWLIAAGAGGEADARRSWAGALAVIVGFWAGYVTLNWDGGDLAASLTAFVGEPKETGYIVAAALAVGLLDSLVGERNRLVASAALGAVVVGLMYLLVGDLFGDPWSTLGTVVRIAVVGVGFAAMRAPLEDRAARSSGATLPVVLTLIGTGAALVLALRGTARIGQHIGILTAAAGASIPIAWWRGWLSLDRGAISAFTVILAGLFLSGYFYMFGAPLVASLLLLAAPHALWIAEIGPLGKLSGWKATLSRVTFVAIAVAGAIVVAWMGSGGGY